MVGCEPVKTYLTAPATSPVVLRARIRSCRCPRAPADEQPPHPVSKGADVRWIGLDVHRDFCEVAIVEAGAVGRAGRIATSPESIGLFAQSLGPTDQVALETTSGAIQIARVLGARVARVVLCQTPPMSARSRTRA